MISFNWNPVSGAATVNASYWAPCLDILFSSGSTLQVKDRYWSKNPTKPYQFMLIIAQTFCSLGNSPIHHYIKLRRWIASLSAAWRLEHRYKTRCCNDVDKASIVVIAVMTKESFSSPLTTFSRQSAWLVYRIWYISWFMKKTDHKVSLLYPSSPYLVWCDVAVNVLR